MMMQKPGISMEWSQLVGVFKKKCFSLVIFPSSIKAKSYLAV